MADYESDFVRLAADMTLAESSFYLSIAVVCFAASLMR